MWNVLLQAFGSDHDGFTRFGGRWIIVTDRLQTCFRVRRRSLFFSGLFSLFQTILLLFIFLGGRRCHRGCRPVIAKLQVVTAVRHFVAISVPLNTDVDVRFVLHGGLDDESFDNDLEGRVLADEGTGTFFNTQLAGTQPVDITFQELEVVIVRRCPQQHAGNVDLYRQCPGGEDGYILRQRIMDKGFFRMSFRDARDDDLPEIRRRCLGGVRLSSVCRAGCPSKSGGAQCEISRPGFGEGCGFARRRVLLKE